jgi:hypothetical protein
MRFSVQCFITGFWLLKIAPALSGTLTPGASATPTKQDVQKLYISVGAPTSIENVIKSGLLSRLRQFNDVEIEEEIGSADYANFVHTHPIGLSVKAQKKWLEGFSNSATQQR